MPSRVPGVRDKVARDYIRSGQGTGSVDRTGPRSSRVPARSAGPAGRRRRLGRTIGHGENGEEPLHPPAFALRARDAAFPADEPLEAPLALPAPVLIDRHHFTYKRSFVGIRIRQT